ncbi:thioesterase family protein [Thalassobacillus sp. CUG 92003]|uniref:acyl-CoA thioesterase n=1 Tax=Thalassobacillus sp. CUG 92003 TaxID=2736641 RepID=UPI0015E7AD50|nr:thioesterase family protein [Thalassobacillus sp. CUG 92003]
MAHELHVKVRASETDGLGHVSNISYFIYLEEARIEVFRKLGTSMDMENWPFILASTSCDYVQQAYFDERLLIETTISRIGTSSFEMKHYVSSDRGLLAKGTAVIVHFNFASQKSEPLTEEMKHDLETLIGLETAKEAKR